MSNKQSKFRKLVPGRCRYCDRQFFYRQSARPKFFCDGKCRQADFRNTRYLGSKRNESVQKNQVKSKTFELDFADRAYSIIGPASVVEIEIGADRNWQLIISPDGVCCLVAQVTPKKLDAATRAKVDELIATIPADLSIPPFLKRAPS